MHPSTLKTIGTVTAFALIVTSGCSRYQPADLLLVNGNVYTFTWDEPALDGVPAANAPHTESGWRADATAVAIDGRRIVFVGSDDEATRYRGNRTRVIDVDGATVLPGFRDSHVHIEQLGAALERVNLVDVTTEEEAVRRVEAWAADIPAGQWIIGWGWDEGLWANRYPDMQLLSERVPEHPVLLESLHGFAAWGNRLALERAGITRETPTPDGGEIRHDENGNPTGILINNATALIEAAVPPPSREQLEQHVLAGLQAMAEDGYVAVQQAGAGTDLMAALESLETDDRLPLRVYAMVDAREEAVSRVWLERGPDADTEGMLITRSVKAFYDGALGSRGARMLEDYSDRPGHRGVAGDEYGFDEELVTDLMRAGFQVCIHAIGDAGNRESLDFLERVFTEYPSTQAYRHRIEHAQVLHPDDISRFAAMDVIASMEPPHAAEDKTWAEDRVGPERIRYAYAWRSLREAGTRLAFNSDLPGSDHDIFYGLHAAITRRDKHQEPPGGWHPEQNMTPEEAIRGYTGWAAYNAFQEEETGVLAPGKWADITVMDVDPLEIGRTEPGRLLDGEILLTIVAGNVVFEAGRQ
jgi:predicted amidohydrolase YtcJ